MSCHGCEIELSFKFERQTSLVALYVLIAQLSWASLFKITATLLRMLPVTLPACSIQSATIQAATRKVENKRGVGCHHDLNRSLATLVCGHGWCTVSVGCISDAACSSSICMRSVWSVRLAHSHPAYLGVCVVRVDESALTVLLRLPACLPAIVTVTVCGGGQAIVQPVRVLPTRLPCLIASPPPPQID